MRKVNLMTGLLLVSSSFARADILPNVRLFCQGKYVGPVANQALIAEDGKILLQNSGPETDYKPQTIAVIDARGCVIIGESQDHSGAIGGH